MPEELEMAVNIPPEPLLSADVLAELRERVRAVEEERGVERQRTGRRILGRRGCSQSWRDRPTAWEPRRNLRPQVATRSRWARLEALMRNRGFVAEYADARERQRAGLPAAFPPGTY